MESLNYGDVLTPAYLLQAENTSQLLSTAEVRKAAHRIEAVYTETGVVLSPQSLLDLHSESIVNVPWMLTALPFAFSFTGLLLFEFADGMVNYTRIKNNVPWWHASFDSDGLPGEISVCHEDGQHYYSWPFLQPALDPANPTSIITVNGDVVYCARYNETSFAFEGAPYPTIYNAYTEGAKPIEVRVTEDSARYNGRKIIDLDTIESFKADVDSMYAAAQAAAAKALKFFEASVDDNFYPIVPAGE